MIAPFDVLGSELNLQLCSQSPTVTGEPGKAIFRPVTVYNKNYPVNAMRQLKQNKCRIKIY